MRQELIIEDNEIECECPSFTPIRKQNKHTRKSKKWVLDGVRVSIHQNRIIAPDGFYEWILSGRPNNISDSVKETFEDYDWNHYTWGTHEFYAYIDPKGEYYATGCKAGSFYDIWLNGIRVSPVQEWNGKEIPKNIIPWK